MNRFNEKLHAHGLTLRRGFLETLQINVGRKCNQACRHCHVDAAPWRTEMMSAEVAGRVAEWITEHRPASIDITGGAPEINPVFTTFVRLAHRLGIKVIDRNNLTILEEDGFEWLPEFLAAHQVEVIASLPCYSAENVNRQRGNGVFDKSIAGLRKLNSVGYGTALPLHLVYNPLGPNLPPVQSELENEYREALLENFGIRFNNLFTITNQPIARFAEDLRKAGALESYLELLATSFNPSTVEGLMCRTTLSVGLEGEVYDCDFNQMLGLPFGKSRRFLWELNTATLTGAEINTEIHCLACTAGCGSSCAGALAA
jgi:radical SAM/Cys-rich protein